MKKTIFGSMLAVGLPGWSASVQAETVTYAEDIAPIFRSSCEQCHRPGEAVPMILLSYAEVRPWAKAIKKVVEARAMPPWFADPTVGHWKNDMRLKDEEIRKIIAWVDSGVPMGDVSKLPPKNQFSEGWKFGEPDMILEMLSEMVLDADLVHEYKYVMIPPGEANHVVDATATVDRDITVTSIMPHMQLRGKDMKVRAKYPDGRVADILNVPNYDFNWQLGYAPAEPLKFPAGTKLFARVTFDNSAGNPYNPDPTAEVRWGLPTYTEMMFAFYTYTFDDEELHEIDPGSRTVAGADE